MSDSSSELKNLCHYTPVCDLVKIGTYVKIYHGIFTPKILRFNTLIFMMVLLVMVEVDLDIAFVHPFQEFLIK